MVPEKALRSKPLQQHRIGKNLVVWFDADNGVFCLGEAGSKTGDAYGTYAELVQAVDAEQVS